MVEIMTNRKHVPWSSGSAPAGTQRNLDHLDYDENLYDFMKSLIPFSLTSTNASINNHILNENGLEKG